jgi:tRNA G18 (ribose-2'-O)-methylase SpoU
MEASRLPVIVVLDSVRSAFNVGLIFRLCDCVNVQELWLTGITPYPGVSEHATNRIRKTGVGGSVDTICWRYLADPVPELAQLRRQGWQIVAAEQGHGSQPWNRVDYRFPLALIMGHERDGVGDGPLSVAHEVIELPARGVTNSANVAVCAGALLYELLRIFEADHS